MRVVEHEVDANPTAQYQLKYAWPSVFFLLHFLSIVCGRRKTHATYVIRLAYSKAPSPSLVGIVGFQGPPGGAACGEVTEKYCGSDADAVSAGAWEWATVAVVVAFHSTNLTSSSDRSYLDNHS